MNTNNWREIYFSHEDVEKQTNKAILIKLKGEYENYKFWYSLDFVYKNANFYKLRFHEDFEITIFQTNNKFEKISEKQIKSTELLNLFPSSKNNIQIKNLNECMNLEQLIDFFTYKTKNGEVKNRDEILLLLLQNNFKLVSLNKDGISILFPNKSKAYKIIGGIFSADFSSENSLPYLPKMIAKQRK